MRQIPLSNGRVALVDNRAYPLVMRYRPWVALVQGKRIYAVRRYWEGGKRRSLRMHRLILPGVAIVDHINGNGLDNRRCNLRDATKSENGFNAGPYNGRRFKGVSFDKRARPADRPWRAMIQAHGRRHYLGHFTTEVEAAMAYDDAARRLHGRFARLNFPLAGELAA